MRVEHHQQRKCLISNFDMIPQLMLVSEEESTIISKFIFYESLSSFKASEQTKTLGVLEKRGKSSYYRNPLLAFTTEPSWYY
jgi:hypothetical protein